MLDEQDVITKVVRFCQVTIHDDEVGIERHIYFDGDFEECYNYFKAQLTEIYGQDPKFDDFEITKFIGGFWNHTINNQISISMHPKTITIMSKVNLKQFLIWEKNK